MEQSLHDLRRSINSSLTGDPVVVYCTGLFLSARWLAVSSAAPEDKVHLIILPTKEAAEYCAADLYSLIEGDRVFFLPDSGKTVERSNYKSSLSVQRTAAVGKLLSFHPEEGPLFVVSYPEAIEETLPRPAEISDAVIHLGVGDEISFDTVRTLLGEKGFIKVDFVSQPGQYAIRGSLIDIFSFSDALPYRISFFGDEVEKIHFFDCNTQLSKGQADKVDIYPDLSSDIAGGQEISLLQLLPN